VRVRACVGVCVCVIVCVCVYVCMLKCWHVFVDAQERERLRSLRARVCVCASERACMHACMHACVRACVRVRFVCVCMRGFVCVCIRARERCKHIQRQTERVFCEFVCVCQCACICMHACVRVCVCLVVLLCPIGGG